MNYLKKIKFDAVEKKIKFGVEQQFAPNFLRIRQFFSKQFFVGQKD